MYAKIQNNAVVEWPIASIHQRFPNTCFPSPLLDEHMPDGYVIVHAGSMPETNAFQKLTESTPVHDGVWWVQNYTVINMDAAEIEHVIEQHAIQVRYERNRLLTESDWTQMADAPTAGKALWTAYRQALRDITAQAGFPMSVQWPEQPIV